jgi:hypothetical protein
MTFQSAQNTKSRYAAQALKHIVVYTLLVAGIAGGGISASASTPTTTTLALTSGGNTVTTVASGSVVTLTATVKAGSTAVTVGQVKFCDATATYCEDSAVLGTAQLTAAGTATLNLRLGVGSHSVKAQFVGTTTNAASTSTTQSISVTGLVWSESSLTAAGNPGNYTLTATVAVGGNTAPTGSVSFVDSSNSNAVISDISLGSASSQVYLPKSYPTGTNPGSLAIADFNGDGIPDLVIANYGDNNVSILLGKGDGTFQAPRTYPAGSNPWSVAVGDFNMDGIPDIVVANWADHTLSVLLGNGDGTFQAQTKYPVGDGPLSSPVSGTLSLAVADVNQDGKPDIVVGMDSNSYISVLLGNGDGTFQTQKQSPLPDGASSLAIADFNGDGKLDIAVGISGNTTLDILLGNGDGTFQAGESYVLASYPDALTVGDFNGDGKPDLAISLGGNGTVAAYVGNGDGTFQTPHIYQLSSGTTDQCVWASDVHNSCAKRWRP